jgi:glyoxylase-like metal-dependent hydrolase (beta-lactamase superfamily II)
VPARLIDVLHLGRERVVGCWQLGDVLVDPGPASCVETLLAALGDQEPRALLLTHIHLDHAGATGTLVERWPGVEVYVHERGAPHLIDTKHLLESARRLYGDDMDRLWGETRAVPEGNVRVLRGGERILGGAVEVAYTPGHASHHVSYLHERTAYTGDTAGARITAGSLTVPPTPPPDIDVEAWKEPIDRIAAWSPERLAVTHFGSYDDVEAQLAALSERLEDWARRAREQDRETFIAGIEEEIAAGAGPGTTPAYAQAVPPDQVFMGLERYWRKRAEAMGRAGVPRVS